MGYRNEIHRVNDAASPSVKPPPDGSAGSFCVPASLQDWAKRGWDIFKDLSSAENSATRANVKDSSILGLSYSLHHCHGTGENPCEKLMLRIDSWTYDKLGETTDLPIMEVVFDAASFAIPAKSIDSLKIMARPAKDTEKVASRAVSAALFFINQINAGQVPDFERVLELHRIHPDLNRETGKISVRPKGNYVARSRTVTLDRPVRTAGGFARRYEAEKDKSGVIDDD